jgi:hypothetical protein
MHLIIQNKPDGAKLRDGDGFIALIPKMNVSG